MFMSTFSASELFHAGHLQAAVAAQVQKVRASPTDRVARFFLVELFLFQGDLERARKQLDVLRTENPQQLAAIEQYRQALDAETKRRAVFAGLEHPKGLTAITEHVRLRLEALPYLARGEQAEAQKRLDEANTLVPALKGSLNGHPFTGLYDADARLGTVLEVIGSKGIYSWVPLELVQSVTMNPPQAPRDVIFRPAHLVLTDGLEGDVLLPGLYPASHESPDDEVKIGRATEWIGDNGEVVRGVGGKVFFVGQDQMEFVHWQELILGDGAQD